MRVLVVEDTVGSSTELMLDLAAAGHWVARCQPVRGEVAPCAGLAGGDPCPLDVPADVAVQVHDGDEDLTMRELGVICAGRAGTPIVNVGRARSRAARITTTPDRLLETLAALGARADESAAPAASTPQPTEAPSAPDQEGTAMGAPVVHFEIAGQDPEKLRGYYAELFGWSINAENPMNYGVIGREDNLSATGAGIGGGIGGCPDPDYPGHVTFYVEVPDVEAALAQAELLGGTRLMGPARVDEHVEIALFADPEGHAVGLIKATG